MLLLQAIEFRTESAPSNRDYAYNVSIRLGGTTDYHLNFTTYQFSFHKGEGDETYL